MSAYHLAHLNIATMKQPLDSLVMVDFVDNLESINALAESSPGFVWRLQTGDGDATAIRHFGPDVLVNMSVWEDVESLHNYVYRTAHAKIMSRRREWFERVREVYSVLWWLPQGILPTPIQAGDRLEMLRMHGPGADAFTFKQAWPAPDVQGDAAPSEFDDLCPVM